MEAARLGSPGELSQTSWSSSHSNRSSRARSSSCCHRLPRVPTGSRAKQTPSSPHLGGEMTSWVNRKEKNIYRKKKEKGKKIPAFPMRARKGNLPLLLREREMGSRCWGCALWGNSPPIWGVWGDMTGMGTPGGTQP